MTYAHRLHFACPQCMAGLIAPARRAGKQGRCPWCQHVFTVPLQSRSREKADTYAIRGGDWTPAEAGTSAPPLWFSCKVCRTRLSAGEDEVGTSVVCPDCGSSTVVPARQSHPSPGPPSPGASDPTDIYPLFAGEGQPPASVEAVHRRYIPVFCGTCHTRMLATEEQVGEKLICPDCGKTTVVPPATDRADDTPVLTSETYDVCVGEGQPAADSPVYRRHYVIRCPQCRTRLHATPDQAGRTITCPDCYKQFVIPPPPAEQATPAEEEPIETYELGQPSEWPDEAVPGNYAAAAPRPAMSAPEPKEPPQRRPPAYVPERRRPVLPRWPFFHGIYEFLGYPGVRICWLWLSLGMSVVLYLLREAVQLAAVEEPTAYFGAMAMGAAAALVGLFWFVGASAYLLTILRETSEGADRIENWPDAVFLDWMLQGVNLAVAFMTAVLVGVACDRGLVAGGVPEGVGIAVVTFYTFPVFLLSVLETGLPFLPFSGPVFRSLRHAWMGWATFYLHSAVFAAMAIGGVFVAIAWRGDEGVVIASVIVVSAILLYFRLLGRLAWYSAEHLEDEEA